MRKINLVIIWLVVMSMLIMASAAYAGVIIYSKNLAGFNAAAGSPPIAIDFDNIAPGSDITGSTICGVTLLGPGAPLIVVRGADTYTPSGVFSGVIDINTNKLILTTGENVLSPGGIFLGPGPNNAIENDDLTIEFAEPVSAFGFDHLSQSADGCSYTYITVFDPSNAVLLSTRQIPISPTCTGVGGHPAGADFWGIVSDTANIKKIVIDENDDNAQYPDASIGFDTFRFTATCDLDNDGINDDVDNCPLIANLNQNDWDSDGTGDVCDDNVDGDGVLNDFDMCAFTAIGEIVDNTNGCSIDQLCPCSGQAGTVVGWKNHGKYVSCVAKTSESFMEMGLITELEKDATVSTAAQSTCGMK